MNSMICAQPKAFSTNYDSIEKAIQKIDRALESEIKYENENYTQLEDIDTFLNDSGFTFHESDDKIHMYLTKEVGDKNVEVVFEARPLPDDMPEGEDGQDEMDMPSENYCDFTVYISDANGSKGLVIEATSMDTEVAFNNVMATDDMEAMKNMARFERSLQEYNGPDFTTLDERIQTSLTEYMEGYGINEHLAAFVECMSLDKDQRLYMGWLSKVKSFVTSD